MISTFLNFDVDCSLKFELRRVWKRFLNNAMHIVPFMSNQLMKDHNTHRLSVPFLDRVMINATNKH